VRRRTRVVRIFPNQESCLRLVRALAVETHEGWLEEHRYLNMALLAEQRKEQMRMIERAARARSDADHGQLLHNLTHTTRKKRPPPVRAAGLFFDRPPFRGLRPQAQNVRSISVRSATRLTGKGDARATGQEADETGSVRGYETPDMSSVSCGRP
jgi:Transposase, Mutator family